MKSEAHAVLTDNCREHKDTSEAIMSGGTVEKSQLEEKSNVRLIIIISSLYSYTKCFRRLIKILKAK